MDPGFVPDRHVFRGTAFAIYRSDIECRPKTGGWSMCVMATRLALTLVLAALALTGAGGPAATQQVTDTVIGSCVFAYGAAHCVRQYRYGDAKGGSLREPSPEEVAEARERERRWVTRCRPELRQDAHGVSRYVYAARGCEYGKDRD
jgi:hypothetical protein